MLVNGKDAIPYMKWKIKFMFETSNQHWLIIIFPIKSTIVGAFISHVLPQFQTTTALGRGPISQFMGLIYII
jgi:uncharacterized membrane protein YoaK (UPF0700 family)